jgi:hypothetical protein
MVPDTPLTAGFWYTDIFNCFPGSVILAHRSLAVQLVPDEQNNLPLLPQVPDTQLSLTVTAVSRYTTLTASTVKFFCII